MKSMNKFDINWEEKFQQLVEYKAKYGDCNVPQYWPLNKALGGWVIRQRSYQHCLGPERVDKLKKLGFIFDIPDWLWNQKLEELVVFYKKYGHTDVSVYNPEYSSLGDWVVKQRKDKKNNMSRLTPEKIGKLDALHFNWGFCRTPWFMRYDELLIFKVQHGHCIVPQKYETNRPLANWVSHQRVLKMQGKLSNEKIELLDAAGFVWQIKIRHHNKGTLIEG
jgi:hypothetical protein